MNKQQLDWLTQALGKQVLEAVDLPGGKNNKAWRLSTQDSQYFVKQYFSDDHARFDRETAFLKLLSRHKIGHTPSLLAADEQSGLALFDWLEGAMDFELRNAHILEAARFIKTINAPDVKLSAAHIKPARGALCNLQDFVDDIRQRLASFEVMPASNQTDKDFHYFLQATIVPCFEQLEVGCNALPALKDAFVVCLSPSDFGFHNALLGDALYFVDFEYAGWDSAEKLVTDFFAQPRYDLNIDWMASFINAAFDEDVAENLLTRCRSLMPLAHLKWALIFLNDFNLNDRQRRQFAVSEYQLEQVKQAQLAKAKRRLSIIDQILQEDL